MEPEATVPGGPGRLRALTVLTMAYRREAAKLEKLFAEKIERTRDSLQIDGGGGLVLSLSQL